MKILSALILIAGVLLSPLARGINPSMPLETFDEKRGFPSISAIGDEEEGITRFAIELNPGVFLSHFKHGFPKERRTEVQLRLSCQNDEDFKGVSVDLGSLGSDVSKHFIQFSVPTADLESYQLEFQCWNPATEEEVMILGGEHYQASLKSIREARETVTENSPVWKEQEKARGPSGPSKKRGNFGGGGGTPFWKVEE